MTVKQILIAIQDMLVNHNNNDPAQREPHELLRQRGVAAYEARVRLEAQKYPASPRVWSVKMSLLKKKRKQSSVMDGAGSIQLKKTICA